MSSRVKRDGTTICELNANDEILWYFSVQPGIDAGGTRISTEKLEAIAKHIADLLNENRLINDQLAGA